ncbi:MAG: OmpA family protein [Panacagrimonas sp.]
MKKRIAVAVAVGLLSWNASAQDEVAAPEAEAAEAAPAGGEAGSHALQALQDRYYVSPSVFWAFADSGRDTDGGYGASLAVGRRFTPELVLEAAVQYNRLDHQQGNGNADLIGLGVNGLFFPNKTLPAYLLVGAAYGDVSSHPGGEKSYGTALLSVGGGWWWQPFDLGFLKGVSLRTDAMWRLDAHNDRRTGDTERNGRKAFQDILVGVGLTIPVGEAAQPPPPVPEAPVQVVPLVASADADGDGVADDLDQCPDTPAGAVVDATGCPVPAAAAASTCKSPEPGEKLDLAGCGTGDVIVLKGVNFDFNKDRLTPNAKTILDGVGEALQTASGTNVEIGGHTDAKGSDDYNQRLSDRRACAVGRYLNGKGIEAGRMSPLGYGETKPVADNETDEGREQNRRVELRILDGAGSGLGRCGGGSSARAAEPAAEPAPETEPAPEPAPVIETPAEPAVAPAPEAAAESAPVAEVVPAEAPAPAASETVTAPSSATTTEQVPEGDVFGSGPASAPAPASASSGATAPATAPGTQQVPESEVF